MAIKTTKPATVEEVEEESIAYYDDTNHDYQDFWIGRDYEHNAEVIALRKLLNGKRYKLAMDYGGGYGRISPVILEFADRLILVDPSIKQLDIAKGFLKDYPEVEYQKITKSDYLPAKDNSIDLVVMVRVSHHLPHPEKTFKEISRVLKPGGQAIIEVANEAHFVNRIKYLKKLQGVPKEPVPIGEKANGKEEDTPFFNHNPATIAAQLQASNLTTLNKLSVSNLRQAYLKEHLSLKRMLAIEKFFQGKLSYLDFGPSIFFLVSKL